MQQIFPAANTDPWRRLGLTFQQLKLTKKGAQCYFITVVRKLFIWKEKEEERQFVTL